MCNNARESLTLLTICHPAFAILFHAMSEIRCPADGLGRVLDEKLAEETQGQSSANRLRVDTESGEVSHNRGTPDGQMRETAARFQRFTMRTLPRM